MAAEHTEGGYGPLGDGQSGEHQQAILAEAYAEAVGELRMHVLGKLAACGALEDGFGWAIFGGEDVEAGSVAELRREVLILSRMRSEEDGSPPLIRIITNEPVITGDRKLYYIAEDVTVLEGGRAAYMVDASPPIRPGSPQEKDQSGEPIEPKAPLFLVLEDNVLAIGNDSDTSTTPYVRVPGDESTPNIYPFGRASGDMEDRMYALNAARAILATIMDAEPSDAYRSAA